MPLEDETLEEQNEEEEELGEEYEVVSLHPVIMEDDIIHDGINPCDDPTCPCHG